MRKLGQLPGDMAPHENESEYERGFRHGQNKAVPIARKLEATRVERDQWKNRYKSQIPQLKELINVLRIMVGEEAFRQACSKPNRWHFEPKRQAGEGSG